MAVIANLAWRNAIENDTGEPPPPGPPPGTEEPGTASPPEVPDPLPTPFPVDDVAAAIARNNPQLLVDGAPATHSQIRTLARHCMAYVAASGGHTEECASLPIFVSGEDVRPATNVDRTSLWYHADWVKLNYENGTIKEGRPGYTRGWYRADPDYSAVCGPGTLPPDQHCHEFPYWATEQGGNLWAGGGPKPWVEPISASANTLQGTRFGQFRSACHLDAGTWLGPQSYDPHGTPFLVVPLPPEIPWPTITDLCNGN